jgi:hypothetical protein
MKDLLKTMIDKAFEESDEERTSDVDSSDEEDN